MLQEQIALQLRKNEVPYEKFTIQPKFQHFLLNKDLTAVSYDEEKGLASFLEYLMQMPIGKAFTKMITSSAPKKKICICF